MNKHSPHPASRLRHRTAFTLVELLVAMTVLVIILTLLVSMSDQAARLWRDGGGHAQRRSNGRALLQFIAREIKMAALPASSPALGSSGIFIPGANLQLIANMPENSGSTTFVPDNLLNPHALFWQAPIAKNATAGDIACVGYFLRWNLSKPGVAQGELCRYYVDPADAGNYLIYTEENGQPANWLSNIDVVAPGGAGNYRGWFADNVIAFWVRLLDAKDQPISQNADGQAINGGYAFDSARGYHDSDGHIYAAPALPAAVEIALVTVEPLTAQRITQPIHATANGPDYFHQDIETFMANLPAEVKGGAQLYTTKVYLQTSLP